MDGSTIMEMIHEDGRTDSEVAAEDARQAATDSIRKMMNFVVKMMDL